MFNPYFYKHFSNKTFQHLQGWEETYGNHDDEGFDYDTHIEFLHLPNILFNGHETRVVKEGNKFHVLLTYFFIHITSTSHFRYSFLSSVNQKLCSHPQASSLSIFNKYIFMISSCITYQARRWRGRMPFWLFGPHGQPSLGLHAAAK